MSDALFSLLVMACPPRSAAPPLMSQRKKVLYLLRCLCAPLAPGVSPLPPWAPLHPPECGLGLTQTLCRSGAGARCKVCLPVGFPAKCEEGLGGAVKRVANTWRCLPGPQCLLEKASATQGRGRDTPQRWRESSHHPARGELTAAWGCTEWPRAKVAAPTTPLGEPPSARRRTLCGPPFSSVPSAVWGFLKYSWRAL